VPNKQNLFASVGIEDEFPASSGWLIRFKQRNGIWKITIQGVVNDCLLIFSSPLQKKIYDADGTGTF
jgi:hypothetical protein